MRRGALTKRISLMTEEIKAAKAELGVTDEQLLYLADLRDDAQTKAIVAETPLADKEFDEADNSYKRMAKYRAKLAERIANLERDRDRLLEKLSDALDD